MGPGGRRAPPPSPPPPGGGAPRGGAAGAGVRVRFGRVTADALGAALDAVLDPASGHLDAARALG
ncbi:hypothetical protein K7G98_43555, partial [Saccharothrix sp. MB29]|nr:hypothetical protein [Saccharothrix sp. MB29]